MTSKLLFPISEASDGKPQQLPPVLFPAFSGPGSTGTGAATNESTQKSHLDWLTNSSFKDSEAQLIHDINRVRTRLEEKDAVTDSRSSFDEFDKEEPTAKTTSQERYIYISDEESSGEPPAKKHKKKKKKERHKRKHKRDDDKDSKRSHKNDKPERREETEEPIPVGTPGGKIFIEDMPSTRNDILYRLDQKPDSDNLRYLELYKMHIARYRRFGDRCLGLPSNVILFSESDKKRHRKSQNAVGNRYYDEVKKMKLSKDVKGEFMNLGEKSVEKPRKSRFDQIAEALPEFIPIDRVATDVTDVRTDPFGVYDAATVSYLEGKPSQEHKQANNQETQPSSGIQGNHILSKTAEFNKHLQEHPDDISKWLDFVEFQNEAVSADIDEPDVAAADRPRGRPNRVLLWEIKASVLEEAMRRNPASVRLRMAQLQLCADQWEPARLDREWERLVFTHPNKPQVWWRRLLFLQSSVSLFSVGKLMKAYAKCLRTLASIRDGTFVSHPPERHLEEYMVAIFQQLICVLLQAGHSEKATALLQATVEVNLFCPQVLHTASRADKLQFLDSFWDSSMPRSGETGALGFASWIERKGSVPFCSMYSKEAEVAAEDEDIVDVSSRSEGWLALEQSRGSRHLFPWRPDTGNGETEEDCEDLERIVMLDDISSCIILFESEVCRAQLITTYMHVLGIKVISNEVSVDKVIQRALRSCLDNLSQVCPSPAVEKTVLYSHPPALIYQTVTDLLLQVQTAKIFTGHTATFINLALMEIRKQHLGVKQKAGGLSSKQWKSLCKELRKNAKNVLKEERNRNNLLLWQQYIDLEWVLGSAEDAQRVIHTALSLTPSLNLAEGKDVYRNCVACKLYQHYAEVELGLYVPSLELFTKTALGDLTEVAKDTALYALASLAASDHFVSPVGIGQTPATLILRARNAYQATLEELLLQQGDFMTWSHGAVLRVLPQAGTLLAHWTACFAFFQYLTIGIRAAMAIFEQVQVKMQTFIAPLTSSDGSSSGEDCLTTDLYMEDSALYYQTVCEDLVSTQLRLLQRHTAAHVVPLSLLRTPLQRHLQSRPDWPLLLDMYIEHEASTNIIGRLRRSLRRLTTSCQTPLVWIYGTLADLVRRQKLVTLEKQLIESDHTDWMRPTAGCGLGSQHQLRAWLERAVNHHTGRHCVLLWRLYFNFEVSEEQPLKAKSVYYRGISQCPAAKALCMDYVRAFPQHLDEVTDLMLEKELRLRTPLEEVDLLLPDFVPRPTPPLEKDAPSEQGDGPLEESAVPLEEEDMSLVEKDTSLEQEDMPLVEKDMPLEQEDMPLVEKDKSLEQEDKSLVEKDTSLEQEDMLLVEKDTSLEQEDMPLVEKDKSLEQEDMSLVEKDMSLEQEDKSLVEKDTSLVQEDKPLVEKDTSLVQENKSLVEKDTSLEQEDKSLVEKDTSLEQEDKSLVEKDTSLEQENKPLVEKDISLEQENKSLVEKDTSLVQENKPLVEKDTSLVQQNKSLVEKDMSLEKENKSLVEKDMSLVQEDMPLVEKDKSLEQEDKSLVEKDMSLEQEDMSLVEKDTSLEQEDKSLVEKDTSLEQENKPLVEKDTSLEQENKSLVEKDMSLVQEDKSLVEKDMSLEQENKPLVEKDTSLEQENKSLVEKDTSLEQEDKSLVEKDMSLEQEDKSLLEKDTSLVQEGKSLVEKDTSLVQKDNSLVEKDTSLVQEYKSLVEKDTSLVLEDKPLEER